MLDFADLHREKRSIPAAFRAVKAARADPSLDIERVARITVGAAMHREGVIAAIKDQIKAPLEESAQEITKS